MDTALTHNLRTGSQIGHFLRHYGEMCAPMCIGFAVGDLVYFWAEGRFGYSGPFSELPELSVLVVTFTMTTPMVAWMLTIRPLDDHVGGLRVPPSPQELLAGVNDR